MNWVFSSLIVVTVAQTALCGFSFPLLLSYVGRAVFLLRAVVVVAPYRVSLALEAADLFAVAIWVVFSKSGVDWVAVGLTLVFGAVVSLLYILDDRLFLYVAVDEEEE
jgi:hypothetical protein